MKKFKAESQRVLEMMINSIYTHKEIFLREILSNASDAMDKLYYKSLSENLGIAKEDLAIYLAFDKEAKTITVTDNGIGMNEEELDTNLGVIAKSGSFDFKNTVEKSDDVNIIGQFGVGFYSAFMVANKVTVLSKKYGENKAYIWESNGADGYTIKEAEKDGYGTVITMYIKDDEGDEKYSEFLDEYRIRELVKKYSDYIRYPIKMACTHTEYPDNKDDAPVTHKEIETLNSMVPLWKKNKKDITEEEYNEFYKQTFIDYENPLKVIHTSAEGTVEYKAVLFIPAKAPFNYYTKEYEKGLKLYTNGVLIADKCSDLLPDYYSFVKGLVDSELTLNVSRETVQHNAQLKRIAQNIEKKIKSELTSMLLEDRANYEKFFAEFGLQLKYGLYSDWGMHKDELQDLVLFHSIKEDKMVTFKEYVEKMAPSQKYIYYATGKTVKAIKTMPQTEKVLDLGYDILCMTHDVDEFSIKFLQKYADKDFKSVSDSDLGIEEETRVETEMDTTLLKNLKEALGDRVEKVKLSSRLKNHPVCLTAEGEVSIEMEKVLAGMPGSNGQAPKAKKVLEINPENVIYQKLLEISDNKELLGDYAEVLYNEARLIEGLPIESPAKFSELVCKLIAK